MRKLSFGNPCILIQDPRNVKSRLEKSKHFCSGSEGEIGVSDTFYQVEANKNHTRSSCWPLEKFKPSCYVLKDELLFLHDLLGP